MSKTSKWTNQIKDLKPNLVKEKSLRRKQITLENLKRTQMEFFQRKKKKTFNHENF